MRWQISLAMMLAIPLAGCMATSGDMTVEAGDNFFEVNGDSATRNGETSAEVGDTFTFENVGEVNHTVTVHRPPDPADEYLVDVVLSPEGEPGGRFVSFTFDEAGTYHVFCRFHGEFTSGMRLTVNVS